MDLVLIKLGSKESPTEWSTGAFMVPKIVFYIALLGVLLSGQTIHAQKNPEQIVMSDPVGPIFS